MQASSITEQVTDALNTPDPIAGVGDFERAYTLLNAQSMAVMLHVLNELAINHMLSVLLSRTAPVRQVNAPRIMAAAQLVRFAHADADGIQSDELTNFSTNAQSLPDDQLNEMMTFISTARRVSETTREGLSAMMAAQMAGAASEALTPAMEAGVAGAVSPGPWNPPGRQPIPFYIGNEAHIGIAARYVSQHPGDPVFTNFIPLSSILQQAPTLGFTLNPNALSAAQLDLKPDILNLAPTRRHLYEIKPAASQALGRTEANMYARLLAAAGIPVTLGPVTEPGTAGVIPAPDGVYLFEAPEMGVIVYHYRRQQLVPVPVPVPSTEPSRQLRFRLQPLTPQQQAVIVTTTAAAVMIIMMIILAPVGV